MAHIKPLTSVSARARAFLDCKWRKEPKRRGMWTVKEVPVRTLGEVLEGEVKELRSE